jgi:hypothetical protein
MSIHIQPLSELTERAKNALIQELGAVDTMRFLNQFRAGNGDYTKAREQLFKDARPQNGLNRSSGGAPSPAGPYRIISARKATESEAQYYRGE